MKKIKLYNDLVNESYSGRRSTNLDSEIKTKDYHGILGLIKEKAPWYLEKCETISPIYRGLDMEYYDEGTIALRISITQMCL